MSGPIQKAAARLLDVSCPPPEVSATFIPAVQRAATLATALEAVIVAHVRRGPKPEMGQSDLVEGFASTFGWMLAKQPPEDWAAAIQMIVQLSIVAATGHAEYDAQERGPLQ